MLYSDTIVAIATPPGEGGIGVVRLSGDQALPILEAIFAPSRPGPWRGYRMRHGHVVDGAGVPLDEALAVIMRGPRSFTAEDVAEVSCHGGPLVLQQVVALALGRGARLAEPGEFTMRAFANGRIDLSRAEATLDVIQAKTDANLRMAQAQLGGWLANELAPLRKTLLGPLAYATALVDFPEDEVEPHEIVAPIREALAGLERLLSTADQGIVFRRGARVALVGRPNAGKSSLLNALLRTDRAIVTPIPGTTRDTLEETANVRGIPVVFVDTAGITETENEVERIGVGRSRVALQSAELVLLILDIAQPFGDEERAIADLAAGKPTIVVLNKVDLVGERLNGGALERWSEVRNSAFSIQNSEFKTQNAKLETSPSPLHPFTPFPPLAISALTGEGLDELRDAIAQALLGGVSLGDGQMVTNPRHQDALKRAAHLLRDAITGHERGIPPDMLALDLTAALGAIGEITGETVGDDLLSAIFSRFCIGK